jgi:TPR repeat protein
MLAPTLQTFRILHDLVERLDEDDRLFGLRLRMEEGEEADNPLAILVGLADRHRDNAIDLLTALNAAEGVEPFIQRLASLGYDGPQPQRRKTADTDPRAYVAATILNADAVINAYLWPMQDQIAGIREILVNPNLDDAARVEAALALDPRAADWISFGLALGAHPDDHGRFYAGILVEPTGGSFQVVDRRSNVVVAMRRYLEEANIIAATMNAHEVQAERVCRLANEWYETGLQHDREKASADTRRQALNKYLALVQNAWTEMRQASAEWRARQGFSIDPWKPQIQAI